MSLTDQLSNKNNKIVEDVVLIAHKMYPEVDVQDLRNAIWMHWFYGTLDVIYKESQAIACVRWNISPTGTIADVLDYWIKDGEKGFRIMKHLFVRNWNRFPNVKYIRFMRGIKYPYREPKLYSVKQMLHLKGV